MHFPITGYSFIPPNRVFAKVVRKEEVLSQPADFYAILNENGKVFHLGKDVEDFHWKSEAYNILKQTGQWYFQFVPSKPLLIKFIKEEVIYKSEAKKEKKSVWPI